MAITYSYPTVTPELQDLLVGTEMAAQGGEDAPRTRTFTVQSIRDLVQKQTLQEVIDTGRTVTNPSTGGKTIELINESGIQPDACSLRVINNSSNHRGIEVVNNTGSRGIYVQNFDGRGIDIETEGGSYTTGLSIRSQDELSVPIFVDTLGQTYYFKVDAFGSTTSKSFIKIGGLSTEYLMADGNARVYTVTNSTQATAFTVATLNSTYPTATIGFTVQCTNAAVLKSYQKTLTGWISYTIANVA